MLFSSLLKSLAIIAQTHSNNPSEEDYKLDDFMKELSLKEVEVQKLIGDIL